MPTTGLLRPGRRERRPATALFPISTYTPLDGSTRGNRAKLESRPYATVGKTGQVSSLSPVETWKSYKKCSKSEMELQGEKGPLFPLTSVRKIAPTAGLSPVERAMALQGEEGQARIFSRPPRPEKSALGHFPPVEPMLALQGEEGQARIFSRPPRPEKSALGHFPPVEPMLALQGREGQPRISLDRAVERECQPRISLDRHLQRNPRLALSLDRHAERNPRLATLPPVEPMLPKIF